MPIGLGTVASAAGSPYVAPIALGISALGALTGNNAGKTAYNAATADTNAAKNSLASEGGAGTAYQPFEQGDTTAYEQFNPQSTEATQDYANYLKQDPYTDNYSTQQLTGATSGVTDTYLRARAALNANAARTGNGDSAGVSGGDAALIGNEAGTVAGAQNNLAYQKINANNARLATLAQVLSGASGGAQTGAESAIAPQAGIDQNVANTDANLAQEQYGQAGTAATGQSSLFGSLGSLAGILTGGGGSTGNGGGTSGNYPLNPTTSTWAPPNLTL